MTPLRVGSLCSGYGGLEMGLGEVLETELTWVADNDPGASKILAHHHPDVPNLGDISKVDWSTVARVDAITAGFPCTDVSCAGLKKGLHAHTRSGVWSHVARGIEALRPSLVFIENVRGLLNAEASSDLELCPWCMGEIDPKHHLRALGAVLGDLADIGFDAEWCGLRASDEGAPHSRFREFILAWPAADAPHLRHEWSRITRRWRSGDPDRHLRAPADPTGERHGHTGPARIGGLASASEPGSAADASGDGRHEGRPEPARQLRRPDASVGGTSAPADAAGIRGAHQPGNDPSEFDIAELGAGGGDRIRADTPRTGGHGGDPAVVAWGVYEPAVRRWEAALGRPAPRPTEPGRTGDRLSPRFVEWLMGLPVGHVTDVPDLSRNAQLKALGNGVVPRQTAAALRNLLPAFLGSLHLPAA